MEFDGNSRGKLEIFLAENEIMFATAPRKYRSKYSKVLAAGSYLKGDPKRWFSNFFLQPEELRPTWFNSWEEFKVLLRQIWGLEDPEGAAESDLRKLTMGDKDHVSYFTSKFRAIQYRLPSWSDRTLRNAYYGALAPRVHTQFVSAGIAPPAGLSELITIAETFDRAFWANYELNKPTRTSEDKRNPSEKKSSDSNNNRNKKRTGKRSSTDSNQQTASSNNNNRSLSNAKSSSSTNPKKDAAYKKFLGTDGKLLPEERERRQVNGLCLLCGQKGHIANDCPKKRKQEGSSSPFAHATITIPPTASTPAAGESKSK